MIKKSAIWFSRLVWTAAVALVVLLAVYVSLGRYYINYVDDYQQLLLDNIVSYSGLPLSIDSLSGRWSKLSPVFTLKQVQLLASDTGKPVLSAEAVSIQLDFVDTLLSGSPQIRRLILNGVSCSLQETSPGKWQLKGYPPASAQHDFDAIADLILAVDVVELGGADFDLHFADGQDAAVKVAELSLRHQDDFRRLRLLATVDDSERPLVAIVEATGDPRDLDTFEARAYLKLDALDLSDQLPAMRALGIELQQAVIDSELWIDWHPGTEIIAQGQVSTPYLDIAGLSGEKLEPLRDLQFSFRMEKSVDHIWNIWIPSFSTFWQEQTLLFEQMELEASGDRATLALPYLSVNQTVKHLLALNLLAEPEQQLIETLAPKGILRNLHLTLTNPDLSVDDDDGDDIPRFFIRANLEDVSIAAWHGAPGVSDLGGYFEAMPLAGMVELDGTEMALDFPHVYHHALQFENLEGQVRWTVNEKNVVVRTGPLDLVTEFGTGTGALSLDLPLTQDVGTPLMNLSIGLRDTDARYRELLLPYVLDPHLLEWLANSIPSGHIVEGGFMYRGSLLPHDHDNRTVQLFFDVEETALDFHADWPPLYDIKGLVLIDDIEVTANVERASMYSLDIGATTVFVKPSEQGVAVKVEAVAVGEAGGVLDIVNNSMINDIVGGAFQSWSLDGAAKASIFLDLPAPETERERMIDVAVELQHSHLIIPEHRVELEEIEGTVRYSEQAGISAQDLSASLMGKPLQATISQDKNDVNIALRGTVDIADVADWSAQPALSFMQGETDYSATILVAGKKPATSINSSRSLFTVTSSLRGIQVDLPPPLGKPRGASRQFSLRLPLDSASSLLTMNLANIAEMQLQFDRQRLESGLLMFGKTEKKQHFPGIFLIKGGVDSIDYAAWQPVVQQYLEKQAELQVPDAQLASSVALAASDFKVDQLVIFSQRFDDSTIDFRQRQDGFWVSVINSTFDGELFLPLDSDIPMSLLLDKLRLPDSAPQSEQEVGGLLADIDLKSLEALDAYIAIADLNIGGESLGTISFELQSEPGSLLLKNLGGEIRDIRIGASSPAELKWVAQAEGMRSGFTGDVDFSDLGVVLQHFNYEQFVESEYGKASFALSWPGRPDEFELAAANGSLSLDLQKGRFLKASNTASGTMKAVGVLNLMNIVRRLKMDFSDIFSKGISYDHVSGSATVEDRHLRIADALEIKSPSSRFNLRGSADLDKAELDMELVATLPVASNLPWVAALAGGLPVAAGVYVASKIFEDQVDRFSSAVYTLNGDWNDPVMKFKRVFDSKKPEGGATIGSSAQSQQAVGEN